MSEPRLDQRLCAEALGTAFLLMAVIGSGIMAERLSGGNQALALLANTLSTGAILVVLILVLGPISGAHLNPAVSIAFALRREVPLMVLVAYLAAQIVGALFGMALAHVMFGLPILQISETARTGIGQWLGEVVASFGLIFTILACRERNPSVTPYAVGLFISSAYWFTSSTSFANPAVTLARAFSDSFAGIMPAHMPAFILAQLFGAVLAVASGKRMELAKRS